MAESIDPNVIRRLRFTPMRDLVRGRISGRLDLRTRIAAAKLPAAAKELITRIVRRTRLWLPEKIAVADELIAHFADGIEAGETIEQLIASFGDERSAARLMARAKRRNRPVVLKMLVAFQMLLVVMFLIFLICCIWFAIGRPSVKTNYVAVLNESVAKVPEDQRAWPVYRQALAALGSKSRNSRRYFDFEGHPEAAELARAGAQKPALGFMLGAGGSSFDPALWTEYSQPVKVEVESPLIKLQLPYLVQLQTIAEILWRDAYAAQRQSDGRRMLNDIDALLNLADQMRFGDFLISGIQSIGLRSLALQQIEKALTETPQLLTNDDLQRLAHRIAKPDVTAGWVGLKGERMGMYDLVQRMYTDDGAGDGRLTQQGIRLLASFDQYSRGHDARLMHAYATAAVPMLTSTRREVLAKYDHLVDLAVANFAKPLREADWGTIEDDVSAMMRSPVASIKYAPLPQMMPSMRNIQSNAERILGERDGLLVGIALEMFRREHGGHSRGQSGAYPKSLDELTPLLLPSVPVDRITGEPLHYRLIDGKPLVYSVGADRDDDGGRVPVYHGRVVPWAVARWDVAAKDAMDGDWVVYPAPKTDE